MQRQPTTRRAVVVLSRNTLYEVEWQAIRVSMLGSWLNAETTLESLQRCREYIGDATNISRVYRVLNLLNATIRGFYGTKLGTQEVLDIIKDYRATVQQQYGALKAAGKEFDFVSEEEVRVKWPQLDRRIRARIIGNLRNRLRLHNQPGLRQELRWFLNIVDSMPL